LEAAKDGSWVGSAPYAYRVEGPRKHKRLVIEDWGKVAVVRRIYREFVEEGRAMHEIARRLNADGILSPRGQLNDWRHDTVRTILENPAYTGDYAGGRSNRSKYHHLRRGVIVKGSRKARNKRAEWIVVPDRHEAVIDRDTWEKAQSILEQGKRSCKAYSPDDNPYIFSGLLRCGLCGGSMRIKDHRYYQCWNREYALELIRQNVQLRDENGPDPHVCPGTRVSETTVLQSLADYLDDEFFSLDGERVDAERADRNSLAWKADRNELTPGDLPEAFAKIREVIAPRKQAKQLALERSRMEKRAKELAGEIAQARANLVRLKDADNIPAAEGEIRQMQTEWERLNLELAKKPPTEKDINAEVTEMLRSLYWLSIYFRLTADPEAQEGACLTGDFRPALKGYLRKIKSMTIHTRITGEGRGTRHVFEYGEVAFHGSNPECGKVEPSSPA
jgi:hypothetical protein